MTRVRFAMVVVCAAALAGGTLSAGGWAVVSLDELPHRLEAGRAIPLTFVVRQHGVTPVPKLRPTIEARSGAREVSLPAQPGSRAGHYVANLVLPQPGNWSITIHSGFGESKLTLLPVSVVDAGSRAEATPAAAERGRRLFVAKGCITCHAHAEGTSLPSLNSGPPLIAQKYQDDFLGRVLADPASTLAARQHTPGQVMPDLDLQPQEISALVAFINHVPAGGTR